MSIHQMWRPAGVLLAIAALALAAGPRGALAQATPLQITAGESTTLLLDGNPSTGYSWVLHGSLPQDVVTVDVLGYAAAELKPGERPRLGAAQKFQVIVTGVAAGRADLVFNYVKGGTSTLARTQQFAIEVLDEAVKAAPGDTGPDPLPDPTSDPVADSPHDMFADPDGD